MNNRNRMYKTRALLFTLAFVVILILANLLITKITDIYPIKIDVTSDERFTLSEESKTVLSKLEKDVTIYLVESGKYPMESSVAEIIDRYRKFSNGKIKVVSKDIVTDYEFAARYGDLASYGSVIFECGEVYKTEYSGDLISENDMLYSIENTITNNIIYVSSDANSLVYNTTGHNEEDLGTITTALNSENYSFVNIDLLRSDIPRNVALLTIYGPKKDFDPVEIAKLGDFLDKGGSIQLYLDSDTTKLTNLYKFAEDWGIIISDSYVVEKDPDRLDVQSGGLMHPNISEYAFAEGIFDSDDTIVIKDSHSLGYDGDNLKGAQNVVGMLYSSEKASSRAISDSSVVSEGEQCIAILSTKFEEDSESNFYVCGTTDLFDSSYFEEGSRYSNRDFYLKSIGWMCGFKDSIKISSKRAHSDILTLSKADGTRYTFVIFFAALAILVFGIVVWTRRRYL